MRILFLPIALCLVAIGLALFLYSYLGKQNQIYDLVLGLSHDSKETGLRLNTNQSERLDCGCSGSNPDSKETELSHKINQMKDGFLPLLRLTEEQHSEQILSDS